MSLPAAIFLMGPTAAGKTALAVELASQHNCEIISVDSALIYTGMDIGTAKPDAATLAQAPHHLISFLDPTESYSAADFRRDALALMADISARGKIPLLVGGTMMYFKFLRDGAASLPQSVPAVRARLQTLGEAHGWPHLHQRLAAVDPQAAERLAPTDSQRLMRALEVYEISGKTLSQWWAEQEEQKLPYQLYNLAVSPAERSILHQRIAQRYELMLEQGFEDEVRALYQRGDLHLDLPSMRCVGYRQMWQYLEGKYSYEEMRERGIIATRQLAKRQITWLRSWPDLYWLDSQDTNILHSTLKIHGLNTILS